MILKQKSKLGEALRCSGWAAKCLLRIEKQGEIQVWSLPAIGNYSQVGVLSLKLSSSTTFDPQYQEIAMQSQASF